ncbi:MAG TPA: STAS domain-containing protein [Opitutaceae bacterium]
MSLVQKHSHGDVATLSVIAPRLDAANSNEALQAILAELDPKTPRVVLDLEQIGYLSSAGLRTLVQTAKRVKADGGRLALCAVRPPVREIIDIAGFDTLMPVLADRTAAQGAW